MTLPLSASLAVNTVDEQSDRSRRSTSSVAYDEEGNEEEERHCSSNSSSRDNNKNSNVDDSKRTGSSTNKNNLIHTIVKSAIMQQQQQQQQSSSPKQQLMRQGSPLSLKGSPTRIQNINKENKTVSSSTSWMIKWGMFILGIVVIVATCLNPFIMLREAATGSLSSYHKRTGIGGASKRQRGGSSSSTSTDTSNTHQEERTNQQPTSSSLLRQPLKAQAPSSNDSGSVSSKTTNSKAHEIILKAYKESFAWLVNYCPKDAMLRDCMSKLFQTAYEDATYDTPHLPTYGTKDSTNNKQKDRIQNDELAQKLKLNPPPWWFYTMLRDGSSGAGQFKRDDITYVNGGLNGLWHEAVSENPNVSMCLIEKVGNTQWRKIFFEMNDGNKPGAKKKMPFLPQRYKPQTRVKLPMPKDAYPTFVFLRDPLERFLSAYMDKCFKLSHRSTHQHCEPNILHDNPSTRDTLMKGIYDDEDGSILRKKEAFELYVDTVPLRWNMHFFPQSLYCNGLYRTLEEYDFVGKMDEQFYHDIEQVAHRYGGRFETLTHQVFDVDSHIEKGTQNVGVETSAPKYVNEFYTPRSLRRVLEFVSIDYIFLNMDIPQWAHDMLAQEDS